MEHLKTFIVGFLISLIYGLLISVFMILYLNAGEKIQLWSEKIYPQKKWSRRGLHLILCLFALGVFFYGFLFWLSIVFNKIRQLSESSATVLLILLIYSLSMITPVIISRKRIFRVVNVKKLWE